MVSRHSRYKKCGCVGADNWSARSVVIPGTNRTIEAPLCNYFDACPQLAAADLRNSQSIMDEYCSECKQACSVVDFVVTPSSVSAPSQTYARKIKAFVEGLNTTLPDNWTTNWQAEVQNNYVGLEIVCQSTFVDNYTEQASMNPVDVLSNIGGQTGLWIGVSFLSIMELVEMLYRLMRYQFHAIRKGPTQQPAANHHE